MTKNIKYWITILAFLIGCGMIFWARSIMMNYDGFGDWSNYPSFKYLFKEARNAALPQTISGGCLMIGSYFILSTKRYWK